MTVKKTRAAISIVLVEPEKPVNVGLVARSMACYGLPDLRIVGSPKITEHVDAKKTAKNSEAILTGVKYFSTLDEAIADSHYALGFTRRVREPGQRMETLSDTLMHWTPNRTHTALIFGRESQGLFQSETLSLSHLVTIPMEDDKISLNLSHAVAIALYVFNEKKEQKFSELKRESNVDSNDEIFPALRNEAQLFLSELLMKLESSAFFKDGKREAQINYVKILMQRLNPTQSEIQFLTGMLQKLNVKNKS